MPRRGNSIDQSHSLGQFEDLRAEEYDGTLRVDDSTASRRKMNYFHLIHQPDYGWECHVGLAMNRFEIVKVFRIRDGGVF